MKDGELREKEQIREQMFEYLNRQKQMAEIKWKKALETEGKEEDSGNSRRTKKENTDLLEFNRQVTAFNQTASAIIRISNSNIDVEIDEQETSEDLI